MATNVIMPALELAQETGKLLRWIKAPGDTVRKGEPIAEIETDKTTIEMESLVAGTLVEIVSADGTEVAVGATIAYVETEA
jgi:pyruvate dehydrogenase E2 component (dihydrolipoamide acetyltransferase)